MDISIYEYLYFELKYPDDETIYYSNNSIIVNTSFAPTNIKLIVYGYK